MQSDAPSLASTLPAMLRASAAQFGAQAAIIDGPVQISYAQLLARSTQAARALISLGVQSGDRVAIWAPNVYEWIVAACGLQAAGAILVPLNTRMKGAEAADILERSGAKVLFCIGDFLGQYVPALLDGLRPASLQTLVVLRPGAQTPIQTPVTLSWDAFLALADATEPSAVLAREQALHAQSTSDILFTSGTTGRPKGVMAAHGPTIAAFKAWATAVGLQAGDRYLIVNPFFHAFGYKAGWVAALMQGATIYPQAVFDAETVLSGIARERISFLPGPPTLFHSMLSHPGLAQHDISSLRVSVTGAASVPPALIRRMREELQIAKVTTAYGLTECGGCATLCDPTDSVETVSSTCGKALPGTEMCCVDEHGARVPAGEPGEVLLRGYHVMQGYFDDPEATAQAIDAQGWLHTGDIGVIDARGYLRITDRLKDMFIVGGFNCYPAEIERQLNEHPAIAQVAVVGLPDERMGEVGCACVILRANVTLTAAQLLAWAKPRMANYKLPRHVLFLESLPLNASNKVLKRELAQSALALLAQAPAA